MNSDLKNLSQLIEMIIKDEDEHNRRRLWSLVGMLAKKRIGIIEDKESTTLLSEMHEMNMEQVIKVQAYGFYKDFPLSKEAVTFLMKDFIEFLIVQV